ncbi:MAG: fibronectin type III domain-containing protein [Thermodesulfovibrionales bacterium]
MFSLLTRPARTRRVVSLRSFFAPVSFVLASLLFLLTAPEAFSASTTLSWDAPTTNTDGSPLERPGRIQGLLRTAPPYSPPVTVGNVTSYTISGLSGGTYYFAVTAYDAAGNESSYSNEVSRVLSTSTPSR